jgi:hypothetical protein
MIVNQFRLLPTTKPSSLLNILSYPSLPFMWPLLHSSTIKYSRILSSQSYIPDSSKSKAVEPKYATKIEIQTARSLYMR